MGHDMGACCACADLGVDRDDDGGVPGQVAAPRLRVLLQQAVHVPQQLHHPLIPRACMSQHSLVRKLLAPDRLSPHISCIHARH